MESLSDLWAAQAELARDPQDVAAWHRVALGLGAAGERAPAVVALKALGMAAAEAGYLPLALLCAKDLSSFDKDAGRHLRDELARLYAQGSARVDRNATAKPPGLPGSAQPGPMPDAQAVKQAALAAAKAAADQALTTRGKSALPFHPLFSSLPPAPFADLVDALESWPVHAGEIIIEQGDLGSSFFVIARGTVRISRGEQTLARLRGGALFGEMALLRKQPRTARASAETDGVLFELSRDRLDALATRHSIVAEVLADHCRRRLLDNIVGTSALFATVSPIDRTSLVQRFRMRTTDPGAALLHEGTEGDGLYVIVTGSAAVEKLDGAELLRLADLGPGDVFGEISLLRARPATATVTASSPLTTLFLARDEFEQVAQSHPALVGAVFTLATERERTNAQAMGEDSTPADDFLV